MDNGQLKNTYIMKQLRYRGEFLSIRGTVWRVEILQDAATPYTVKELEFDGTPLVLEWPKTDKEEVLCGSRATLTLISPGDRNFIDLYTIKPATIRMDVYRDGALYWSGTLDPEFYEEPYEQAAGYPVSLTFSDFGILDRLNLKLRGRHTLREYLVDALACAGLPYTGYDSGYVSTTFPGSTAPLTGSEITVASDNFVDEDGEWSSLKKVVEGILQPLGMKLIQRAGRVWLYDLNGLYSRSKPVPVEWSGDSQTLGVDKVANNVTITFSPYAKSDLLPAFEYTRGTQPRRPQRRGEGHRGCQVQELRLVLRRLQEGDHGERRGRHELHPVLRWGLQGTRTGGRTCRLLLHGAQRRRRRACRGAVGLPAGTG